MPKSPHYYWAIRPKGARHIRIERAETAREACDLAFGRGAKNLGTRVAVIQSDRTRIALLTDPNNWQPV